MLEFSVWKQRLIGLIIVAAFALALPSILPQSIVDRLPSFVSRLPIDFAIDLRGGSRITIELVQSSETGSQSAQNPADPAILAATMEVLRKRFDGAHNTFPHYSITQQRKNQIRVEVPALFDVGLLKNFATIPARLAIYQSYQGLKAEDVVSAHADLPADAKIFYDYEGDPPIAHLVYTKPLFVAEDMGGAVTLPGLDGEDALAIEIALNMPSYSDLIAVMDGEVIARAKTSADGSLILLDLVPDFAENLRHVINSGPLPGDTHILEERSIGADLGDDFARAGLKAAIGALLVVALFMVACYGLLGLFANITLTANLAILISILSLMNRPLSLAGFAGLVLTVGVAVDSLILIYERIREERRNGAVLRTAVTAGFLRARNTIIDANITTLLGAMMLFLFGVGPISGFALTVTIGICASLFTSLIFARLLLGLWLHHFKPTDMPARFLVLVPNMTAIAFMRLRKFSLSLAIGVATLAIILLSSAGLHYGIDFAGGSLAVLAPRDHQSNIADIVRRASELNIGNVQASPAQDGKNIYLTIPSQSMGEAADQTVALKLRGEFDIDYQLERMDVVGPSVAGLLGRLSLWAVFLSLAAILLYVWARFNWKFGLGALMTTLHDIVVLALIFALTQWEFNLWSIAALLAIIGYSLNDTIVVYDRIRTLLIDNHRMSLSELIDLGINRTLSRTILTSLATLLAHIPLYYYGSTDMRNFASILLMGILVGTASSIFIAGPLLAILEPVSGRMKSKKYDESD